MSISIPANSDGQQSQSFFMSRPTLGVTTWVDVNHVRKDYSLKEWWNSIVSMSRKISLACRNLLSTDLLGTEKKGFYYFQEDSLWRVQIAPIETVKENPTGKWLLKIRVETILNRATAFPAPDMIEDPLIRKKMLWKEEACKRRNERVQKTLDAAKKTFNELDKVQKISFLKSGDSMLIYLKWNSTLYTVTVKESSKELGGKTYALCDVTYELGIDNPWRVWKIEGFLYLPIEVDKVKNTKVIFSSKWKMVQEFHFPAEKMYLVRAPTDRQ